MRRETLNSLRLCVSAVKNLCPYGRITERSVGPGIFDEMVLAIENARSLSSFSGLGITDELTRRVHAGHFEHEEDVVGVLDDAPDMNQSKACLLVGCLVRSEHGLPTREVRHAIAT